MRESAVGRRSARLVIASVCGASSLFLVGAGSTILGPNVTGGEAKVADAYDAMIWGFALFAVFWLVFTSESFGRRFVGRASPESLAYLRILCSSILLASTLWEDLASTVLIPAAAASPVGVLEYFHMLPGVTALTRDAGFLRALEGGTALLLVLAALGLKTRFVLPFATFAADRHG